VKIIKHPNRDDHYFINCLRDMLGLRPLPQSSFGGRKESKGATLYAHVHTSGGNGRTPLRGSQAHASEFIW
jgi:hypothetical protein